MVWYILILYILLIWVYVRVKNRRIYKLAADIPGMKILPIIGNAHLCRGSSSDILKLIKTWGQFSIESGGVVKAWLGHLLYIVITSPTDAEIILNSCLDKSKNVYNFFRPWVGETLFIAEVTKWKSDRKLLSPAFNKRIFEGFMDTFCHQNEILLRKLQNEEGHGKFDIYHYISRASLDIICESALGLKLHSQNKEECPYVDAVDKISEIIYMRVFKFWLQPDFIFGRSAYAKQQEEALKVLHDVSKTAVRERKEAFVNKNNEKDEDLKSRKKNFLDLIIELSQNGQATFSDEDIRQNVDGIILGGYETSALTASYALVSIGAHKEVQENIRKELLEVFDGTDRPIEKDDLSRLTYLEMVIKETLRLYPPVPLYARQALADIQLEKHVIPKGSTCVINAFMMHRNPKLWGADAEQFKPERWKPENTRHKIKSCYFIPFSYGPRICLGMHYAMMSLKIMLASILRRYEVTASEADLQLKAAVMLKAAKGHLISIKLRK